MVERHSLARLGMDLDAMPSPAPASGTEHTDTTVTPFPRAAAPQAPADASLDHFVRRDGLVFAGRHLILDLWDARRLDDRDHIEAALREAIEAAGATLLHIHLHAFGDGGGVSGVAVLAESHISVHTWPERSYAAFDVFMCGDARPDAVVPVLRRAFAPGRITLNDLKRGIVDG